MVKSAHTEAVRLDSFGREINAAVIGASGGLGSALADAMESCAGVARVIRISRSEDASAWESDRLHLDVEDEDSIVKAADAVASRVDTLHLVVVASGILHLDGEFRPEKSWRELSGRTMEKAFRVNATGPALVAKHFLPLLARPGKSAFAAVSARVGSIGDNRLGGWYAYRASKAALNMLIRTLSVELARRNPAAICVGLHPGTVDTPLSRPFQRSVPEGQLFTPVQSAAYLLNVLDGLDAGDSGGVFAWDGARIPDGGAAEENGEAARPAASPGRGSGRRPRTSAQAHQRPFLAGSRSSRARVLVVWKRV